MSHHTEQTSNLIQELRLRRWARRNYVAAAERSVTWHPHVLDEMQQKDAELERLGHYYTHTPISAYVPLAPTTSHTLHEAHAAVSQPNIAYIRQTDLETTGRI